MGVGAEIGSFVLKSVLKAVAQVVIGVCALGTLTYYGCNQYNKSKNPIFKTGNVEVRPKQGTVFTTLTPNTGLTVDFNAQTISDVVIVKKDTAHTNVRGFEKVTDTAGLNAIKKAQTFLRKAQAAQ